MTTIFRLLQTSSRRLRAAEISEALAEAEILLAHVLGKDRLYLHAYPEAEVPPDAEDRFDRLLARRLRREPLAYLIGKLGFYGRTFTVTPAVLIPRPETEVLVEAVLKRLPKDRPLMIADIGTGSGIIAISLACELPQAHIFATDISPEALEVARMNARNLGVEERATFLQGDLCQSLEGLSLDAICSNPPYISAPAVEALDPEIRNWEPRIAVEAGAEGIGPTRTIIARAPRFLKPGGWLALEMAAGSSEEVAALIQAQRGLTLAGTLKDLAGIERVALAQRIG